MIFVAPAVREYSRSFFCWLRDILEWRECVESGLRTK